MSKKRRRFPKKKKVIDKHQIGLDALVKLYYKKPLLTILAVNEEYPSSRYPIGELDIKILDSYNCLRYVEYKSRHSNNGYRKAIKQLKRWINYTSNLPTYVNQTLIGMYCTPQTGMMRIWKYKNNQMLRK